MVLILNGSSEKVRKFGVNQLFRLFEGIRLHPQSRQIRFFFQKRPFLLHTYATRFGLQSYISTIV